MTIHVLGSLNYHNETILEPIISALKEMGETVNWVETACPMGANVHVADLTTETLMYWDSMKIGMDSYAKNDKFLITDFWNPIIFELKFLSTRKNMNWKFYTIHHGSSHLSGDFSAAPEFEWARWFEDAWRHSYDKIFFGSKNAKSHFLWPENEDKKLVVSYLPVNYIFETRQKVLDFGFQPRKDMDVIMPLRLDDDKGAQDFFTIVRNNPEYTFHALRFHTEVKIPNDIKNLKMHDEMNRVQLFDLMAQCKYVVSCAKQETFGYGVLEAIAMGCIPLLQKSSDNCYDEFYHEWTLFDRAESVKVSEIEIPVNEYGSEDFNPFKINLLHSCAEMKIANEIVE